MKILIFLLLFPVIAFSQDKDLNLFVAGSDTVTEADSQDTVAVRIGINSWGPYINLAQEVNSGVYITAAEKSAETPNIYNLASESWWTYAHKLQVRITSPSETVTSDVITIRGLEGACTLIIIPDTLSTYTDYGTSRFIGF